MIVEGGHRHPHLFHDERIDPNYRSSALTYDEVVAGIEAIKARAPTDKPVLVVHGDITPAMQVAAERFGAVIVSTKTRETP